jgi:alpha-D-ribose 1-methylphosphonate 5-triphosphate synthase subunit PhnG
MNPWLILAAVLAIGSAAGTGYYKGREAGQAKVQAAWDAERLQQQEAHNKALQESIDKTAGAAVRRRPTTTGERS